MLLNEDGLNSISRIAFKSNNYNKGDPILVVSPTPVFGFELAEELQEYLASKSNVYKWDLETWASNERGFIRFLTFILSTISPNKCIFLSGDVHYGFTQRATFKVLQEKNEKKELATSVIQLTSSALKTSSLSKDVVINEILGRLSQLFSSRQSLRIGWNDDILARSKKLKYQNNSVIYAIINRIKRNYYGLIKQQPKSTPPDWVESRYIVQSSGFRIPSLVITDNNIGLVTISKDTCKIFHKLLVHKGNKIKVHEAVLQIDAL
jgi:hypothetical protein